MQLVLQHLYTGRVQLPVVSECTTSNAVVSEQGVQGAVSEDHNQGLGGRASRKRDADGAVKATTHATEGGSSSMSSAAPLLGGHLSQLVPLIRAADALLLPDLRDSCLKAAHQQMAPDNALPLLLAAHQARVGPLEEAAMAYAVQHARGKNTVKGLAHELGAASAGRQHFLASLVLASTLAGTHVSTLDPSHWNIL
jgi:hypothetical protein